VLRSRVRESPARGEDRSPGSAPRYVERASGSEKNARIKVFGALLLGFVLVGYLIFTVGLDIGTLIALAIVGWFPRRRARPSPSLRLPEDEGPPSAR
jgi:hypothetical protein